MSCNVCWPSLMLITWSKSTGKYVDIESIKWHRPLQQDVLLDTSFDRHLSVVHLSPSFKSDRLMFEHRIGAAFHHLEPG